MTRYKRATIILAITIAALNTAFGQDETETFTVNSPIIPLRKSMITHENRTLIEPANGNIIWSDAATITQALCKATTDYIQENNKTAAPDDTLSSLADCNRTTFYHVLAFQNQNHDKTTYQHWYVHDIVKNPFGTFLTKTHQGLFQASFVRGEQDFQLIYIHFLAKENEQFTNAKNQLLHPIGYQITIAKRPPQLLTDAQALFQLVGWIGAGGAAAAALQTTDPVIGYFTVFQFHSSYNRSNIIIAGKLQEDDSTPTKPGETATTAANDAIKHAYTNEGTQLVGLSIAVPLNSYRDVDYNQTNNTLEATTIKRENIYAVANIYIPKVDIGQTLFRYLPHPLFGVPIKGQPLRHLMAGLAIGLNWAEPFAGIVFDRQQRPIAAGSTTLEDHLVRKLVVGINIPIATAKAALSPKK